MFKHSTNEKGIMTRIEFIPHSSKPQWKRHGFIILVFKVVIVMIKIKKLHYERYRPVSSNLNEKVINRFISEGCRLISGILEITGI